jgi:D-alanine-D-alanine ligase-like ATP-grasp enzyme
VEESVAHAEPFIVEQYIYGKEAAVGVIDDFRNQKDYVLPVTEVRSPSRGVLSDVIRSAEEYAVAGGGFRADEREALATLAKKLHAAFGAEDYSQSEFIIDNRGKIWFIELDTHPHLTPTSPFLVALDAVGSSLKEFVASVLARKN